MVPNLGNIILLETKGDDRDNSDSDQKLKLDKAWQAAADRNYKYFMVFDQKQLDGALKLDEFMPRQIVSNASRLTFVSSLPKSVLYLCILDFLICYGFFS